MLLQYFGVKMVNMKRRASGLTLKKRHKGYSKKERNFSRFTLEAALFPLASLLTTLGRRGGGLVFLYTAVKRTWSIHVVSTCAS